jgi:DNA-binding Lrp family transcriptional regulator
VPTAFVCITTEPASMVEVLKEVRAVEGVEEAQMVYGVYDIVVKVKGETMDKLKHIITERIRRIDKVRTTLTMMVVESE